MSARSLRRFDLYPNRGIDLPYQPNTPRNSDDWFEPIACKHGIAWTNCALCSVVRKHP